MFFKFLFDIAKPPVHHASGAFYFFTFLLFYLFTFLPLKTRGLSFFTFLPFYFFTFFRNFAPKS